MLFSEYGFRLYSYLETAFSLLFPPLLILFSFLCEIWWHYWYSLMKIGFPIAFVTTLLWLFSCFSEHSISLLCNFFLLSQSAECGDISFVLYILEALPSMDSIPMFLRLQNLYIQPLFNFKPIHSFLMSISFSITQRCLKFNKFKSWLIFSPKTILAAIAYAHYYKIDSISAARKDGILLNSSLILPLIFTSSSLFLLHIHPWFKPYL